MTAEVNKIVWLVKKGDSDTTTLGFLRDHKGGSFIIGGDTGSHCTGHEEGWEGKWKEYVEDGFISSDTAIQKGILDSSWTPPAISKDDQELVDKINQKLL